MVANEAAFLLRDNALIGYAVILDADNDSLNTPNTLRVTQAGLFGSAPVTSVPLLPFGLDLKPGTWHAVKALAAGSQVSVYVDGILITQFEVPITGFPSAAMGSFGFQNGQGAEALFRNLAIVSSSGETLYASALTDNSVLDVFAAGTNPLPVIIDGAKRDRLTFAGDLVLAAPTVYYTTGDSEYVAGSLSLFAGFQSSTGEVSSVLSPLLSPGIVVSDALAAPNGGYYSLSYSIHFINALYDYYLYTGDLDFVANEWPVVEKEFAYLRSTANPQTYPQGTHLVVTNPINGMDWNVNTEVGTVTEYNVLYYRALNNAAAMAKAIGREDEGAAFTQLASLVKSEINSTLFDAAAHLYHVSDTDQTTVAQDANSLAVLYGVALSGEAGAILETMENALVTPNGPEAFLSSSGTPSVISPFISGFDVYAHFEIGDATGALDLIRTVWGLHMTHDKPFYSGAVFETLALDGTPQSPTRTLSHGWSSGPTSALSKYVLGVRPVEPGYKTWLIEPQPADLTWAQGSVPTPYGPIALRWQKQGNNFMLNASIPRGTNGTIGIPLAVSTLSVTDNGRPITAVSASKQVNGRTGYVYVENMGAGTHLIEVK